MGFSQNPNNIDFNKLSQFAIFTPKDIMTNERVIILKGDIAGNGTISQHLLTNQNLVDSSNVIWDSLLSDLQYIRYNLNALQGNSLSGSVSNQTIEAGIYEIAGDLNLDGNIKLTGLPNDTFIFNIPGNLTINNFTNIVAPNIKPSNIIFNVGGKITAGDNSSVVGMYLSDGQIDFSKHIQGNVSLFSLNGNLKLSSLLNILSPHIFGMPLDENESTFADCIVGDTASTQQGILQSPGGICSGGNNPFGNPENWKLNTNFNQNTPIIEVGVNFHSLLDANGQNNFQNNHDTLTLLQLFDWAQSLIRYPRAPSDPQTTICGGCHVKDSKIQLVLKRMEFYNSNYLHNASTGQIGDLKNAVINRNSKMLNDINVFWSEGSYGTAGGFAGGTQTENGSNNKTFSFIVMLKHYDLFDSTDKYHGSYASAITLAHEFGHNLDFSHTYSGGGASAVCNTSSKNYLEDVHGLGSSRICPHNGSWSCGPFTSSLDNCTNNLMGGTVSAQYLSPKQIGIAHRSLRVKTVRQKINNCPFSNTPLEVTADQTWSRDVFLYRNVIVKNNSTLTITCRIGLPAEGKIIVEKGSRLIIDAGTLTNSCKNSYWYGVQLNGDNNFNQFPLNQPSHQAKLVVKNGAILENANYTITFAGGGYGGLVAAENSTFRNSRRFVEFLTYPYANHSYFKRCLFINDADLVNIHANTPLPMVTLWDNKGVKFFGCTFKDETEINVYGQQVGNGIFSLDANYKVLGACNNATLPCTSYDSSVFINLNQGIAAINSGSDKTITVNHAKFINNSMGLSIKALDNVFATNNSVLTGGLLKSGYQNNYLKQYGFYSQHSTGYVIEGNYLKGENNPVIDVVGVQIENSGTEANEVYLNGFKNNYYGQRFKGINRKHAFQGLQFLCNINDNTHTDVIVEIGGSQIYEGIRDNQGLGGSNSQAAGNIFSSALNGYHIDNSASLRAIQYHDLNNKLPTLLNGPVLTTAISTAATCQRKAPLLDTNGNSMGDWHKLDSVHSYYQMLDNYNNLLYTYYQNIDNGNTDSLLIAINMMFNNQAIQLRDDLMAQSPYLSEQALRDAAATGILSDGQLLEVCLANPDATQNGGFLDYVQYEIPNPLPASMIQLIYQSWDGTTARTLLEYELSNLNANLGWRSNQILHYYYTDTLNHYDSIMSLLESRNSRESDYRSVEIAMSNHNYTIANQLLSNMANEYEFDANQSAEFSNFEAYISVRQGFYNQDKSIMDLNENDLNSLRNIADAKTGRSSVLAQNILCFGYDECSIPEGQLRVKYKYPKRTYNFINQSGMPNTIERSQVTVIPNPANNITTVNLIEVEIDNKVLFQLNNTGGQKVMEKELTNHKTDINVNELKKGVYIYKISKNGKVLATDKLVVQ